MVGTDSDESSATEAPDLDLVLPPSAGMTDVHTAWLAAGSRSDVGVMRKLLHQFPEWLDLQRPVGPPDASQRQARFCSWDGFHLRTLGASALHTAAWKADVAVMEFLLESGQHPDSSDDSGLTSMMVAIMRLNLLTTRCVFRNGEAVRRNLVVDCRKEEEGQLKQVTAIVELLIWFGAKVDARSQDGKTALHCTTNDDAYEVAKLLLDAGAESNAQDENGKTPLHYCIQEGGLVVTDLLLSRGADIYVADTDGITPFKLVLQRADLNVLQLLLNHQECAPTSQRQAFAASVLLQAVDAEAEEVVRFVVDHGYAPVTIVNSQGETAMHRAILRRSPSVMELLSDLDLEGDTLVTVTTKMETCAHYAAVHGSTREVETLLLCLTRVFGDLEELEELGVTNPLNAADQSGRTSLYVAGTALSVTGTGLDSINNSSRRDRDAKVRLLVDHGGRLFQNGFLVQALGSSRLGAHHLVLPVQVQRCLQMWLVERGSYHADPEDAEPMLVDGDASTTEALVELCMQWIACITCHGRSMTLVAVVTCAGYAHEVLPLLLDLPLRRQEVPVLLHSVEKVGAQRQSALLLQLHTELLKAWRQVAVLS